MFIIISVATAGEFSPNTAIESGMAKKPLLEKIAQNLNTPLFLLFQAITSCVSSPFAKEQPSKKLNGADIKNNNRVNPTPINAESPREGSAPFSKLTLFTVVVITKNNIATVVKIFHKIPECSGFNNFVLIIKSPGMASATNIRTFLNISIKASIISL
jgi:hypothetical protein